MKGITSFALEKNRVTLLFLLLMVFAGFFSYLTYPKQEDPSIQIREAIVWAYFPGMAPRRVEDLITRKLEEQIRLLGDVDYIKSDSKRGMDPLLPTLMSNKTREDDCIASAAASSSFSPCTVIHPNCRF